MSRASMRRRMRAVLLIPAGLGGRYLGLHHRKPLLPLTGFSPQAGAGTITAVTAYKLSGDLRTLYGTVLGPTARALYLRASA